MAGHELDPTTLQRVRRLALASRRRVSALLSGEFRSQFRGTGIEFETVREYVPGDDVRALDWNVTARLSRPYVKLFVESRERPAWLVVDRSASMAFGSDERTKADVAAELAGVLALAAMHDRDATGIITFKAGIDAVLTPSCRADQLERILLALHAGESEGGGEFRDAFDVLERRLLRRSVLVLISDFHAPHDSARLARLARRHDVIACIVFDPRERELAGDGLVACVDPETGRRFMLDAADARERAEYAALARAEHERRLELLRGCGAEPLEVSTQHDVVERLLAHFGARSRGGAR
ncbi:MAG: DUF58 domain-containing protein [Planctomycetes bacterium]|nr:DUF58 domain-containing protein [Planctomycetota bacterium]